MYKNHFPLITVGLSFYNNEKTLANAIKSVLLQTYSNFELILIDDGSTDSSYDVACIFACFDKRIKLIRGGENKGLIFRLNQIIDLAEGKYMARMDSDDMMMPEKLHRQMDFLIKNDTIDIIDTAAYTINEKDEPTGMRKLIDVSSWDRKKVLKKRLFFHPTIIAKTSWYRQNKYDENFVRSEDFELWCRTFDNIKFVRIYEPLFFYREGNVDIKGYITSSRSHRKALRKYQPGVLSKIELASEILQSHLKAGLYRIFGLFNMQYFLAMKRNVHLNETQKREVATVIKKIKSWEIDQNNIIPDKPINTNTLSYFK
jgi:glycosyltransferase involved in cell wall biosynthesis